MSQSLIDLSIAKQQWAALAPERERLHYEAAKKYLSKQVESAIKSGHKQTIFDAMAMMHLNEDYGEEEYELDVLEKAARELGFLTATATNVPELCVYGWSDGHVPEFSFEDEADLLPQSVCISGFDQTSNLAIKLEEKHST